MGVDLATFRFDFDLTFAVLLMNADGTVYHRYGGRSSEDAESSLSMPSLVRLLKEGVKTHADYAQDPKPPAIESKTLDDVPAWAEKVAQRKRQGKPIQCYHCHMVNDALLHQGRRDGTWRRSMIWRWPPPERIGLTLDRDVQNRVTKVAARSQAAKAGVRAGDTILRFEGQRVLTHMDLSWVLERTSGEGGALGLTVQRGEREKALSLKLKPGWREGTFQSFAWRPSKWQLRPRPGFGGRSLTDPERKRLGIKAPFAFRVGYIVTWGDEPHYGRAAAKAGIRKGDVVLQVGDAKLSTPSEFHAWWRLTRRPGETVEIQILRKGKRRTLKLKVIEPPQ